VVLSAACLGEQFFNRQAMTSISSPSCSLKLSKKFVDGMDNLGMRPFDALPASILLAAHGEA
jgi:hypothetical protein